MSTKSEHILRLEATAAQHQQEMERQNQRNQHEITLVTTVMGQVHVHLNDTFTNLQQIYRDIGPENATRLLMHQADTIRTIVTEVAQTVGWTVASIQSAKHGIQIEDLDDETCPGCEACDKEEREETPILEAKIRGAQIIEISGGEIFIGGIVNTDAIMPKIAALIASSPNAQLRIDLHQADGPGIMPSVRVQIYDGQLYDDAGFPVDMDTLLTRIQNADLRIFRVHSQETWGDVKTEDEDNDDITN